MVKELSFIQEMEADKLILKKILEQIKEDLSSFKITGKLKQSIITSPSVDLNFSDYEKSGGISISYGTRSPKQKTQYIFDEKKQYIDSIWNKFSENLSVNEKKNILGLIEYSVNELLSSFSDGTELLDVEDVINRFIDECEDKPIQISIKIKVNGLYLMGVDQLYADIEDLKISIRKPNEEDFDFFQGVLSFLQQIPSAIINLDLKIKPTELENDFKTGYGLIFAIAERIIFSIRMFKLGSINIIEKSASCNSVRNLLSIMNYAGFPNRSVDIFSKYKCGLDKYGFEQLLKIISFMYSHLKLSKDANGRNNLITPLSYNFYCDALSETIPSSKRIAYIIIGLESIYSTIDDRDELSYKLRIRCAKIMSLIGYDSKNVANIIKIAYSIRSSFAHGKNIKNIDKKLTKYNIKSVDEFETLLINYLRISIILEISLENKDSFLTDLDNALIKDNDEFNKKYLKNAIFNQLNY